MLKGLSPLQHHTTWRSAEFSCGIRTSRDGGYVDRSARFPPWCFFGICWHPRSPVHSNLVAVLYRSACWSCPASNSANPEVGGTAKGRVGDGVCFGVRRGFPARSLECETQAWHGHVAMSMWGEWGDLFRRWIPCRCPTLDSTWTARHSEDWRRQPFFG